MDGMSKWPYLANPLDRFYGMSWQDLLNQNLKQFYEIKSTLDIKSKKEKLVTEYIDNLIQKNCEFKTQTLINQQFIIKIASKYEFEYNFYIFVVSAHGNYNILSQI